MSCSKISHNVQDYLPKFGPLLDACQSVTAPTSSIIPKIQQNILQMKKTMYMFSGPQQAMTKIMTSSLTAEDRTKKLEELRAAISKFLEGKMTKAYTRSKRHGLTKISFTDTKTTAQKFMDQTNTAADSLDVSKFTTQCPKIIQDKLSIQTKSATDLMKVMEDLCIDMNTAYTTYKNVIDTQKSKI